ncbi:MAG: DivIVA domain-containing protein [Gemmatimonadetes bacterium]|nr:DivIVA domain-containing protein [Gemmatimonadota bacterium]
MIDLTPLEVRKKKGDFRRALRGYEPALVDDFLDLAADRIEQLLRDNGAMAQRLTDLERRVNEYRDRERALTDALVTAQEMREEIRAQAARESELALRTSTQEAEARLRDAQQRAETMLRDAEQRSSALLRDAEQGSDARVRDAEQRAQTLVRAAELQAADTVRTAEQGAADALRLAQQEADAELLNAQQEADRLRAEVTQVREREEEALRRLRELQQQHLGSYRRFLERELAELDAMAGTLAPDAAGTPPAVGPAAVAAVPPPEPESETEPEIPAQPRDSRAAAAAAVLAQSFLAEDLGPVDEELFELEPDLEPFEPEPVYEEDLEPRPARPELLEPEAGAAAAEPAEAPPAADDADTMTLLENAELAGYRLDIDLVDEVPAEPELLLEEPAGDEGGDDDWLSSIIEEKRD